MGTDIAEVELKDKKLFAISGGDNFACGLEYGSRFPVCWGDLQLPARLLNVSYTSISCGSSHCCAIRSSDSRADCWGNNGSPPGENFLSVSSGKNFSCGLTQDGALHCWGGVPESIQEAKNERFASVFVGGRSVCGLTSSTMDALCWDEDHHGRSSLVPPGLKFSSLAGGLSHTCGIRADNHQVMCWGDDHLRQLQAPKSATFSSISAGNFHTCGVTRDDPAKLLCWGNNVAEFEIVNLNASQALCMGECGKNQFQMNKTSSQCPSLSDKVCLDCSICVGGNVETSPCGVNSDRQCGSVKIGSGRDAKRQGGKSVFVVVLYVSATLSLALIFMGAVWSYLCRIRRRKGKLRVLSTRNNEHFGNGVVSISAEELKLATKNYSEEMILGRGAFGTVYKGVLENGYQVAIKRGKACERCDAMFDKELELLARTHHSCLVNLFGYCKEENVLVFEFMSRGTVHDNIFQSPTSRSGPLEWVSRIRIAAQAARGLEYLHKYASPSIIHRDIKSANILIDFDWNAHISDFGISLCGPQDNATHLSNMTIVGTPGYLDPEYGTSSQLTLKSDVYSFGVVLLELLSGRKPVDLSRQIQNLVAWVIDLVGRDEWSSVLDPRLAVPLQPEPLFRVLKLALECTRLKGKQRPSMTQVAKTLEEVLEAIASSPPGGGDTSPLSSTVDVKSLKEIFEAMVVNPGSGTVTFFLPLEN
ncbi:serine/threonine-protein kinase-like protein CR4 [Selaginella moellendorffii]|uniref:serine/threonine-protein kinase-like protein CR4 n=1 Tax=Selaginella moellendorffii TaxID=88036 RepID=UPI000D1C42AD|nr:serine/threonine-protein kinase-like protein CR4 [Selaginella moellendorffii]|eukprot:XP_024533877.1 serine/threonine-protein kinase-like protein CR4 [Selaginella moellendorffii]